MTDLVRAAGLLVYRKHNDQIEYLLLQASYEPFHWTPPKGHVDPGEDEREAAIRETSEEAGITSEQLEIRDGFKHEMHYNVKNKPKRVIYWIAHLKNDQEVVLSHEHQEKKWASLEEAIKLSKYAEMEKLLREAQAFLES
uniref:Bis(5'-nucleosyl)-tetraphosphatase [asymmetrical] n=1 Tax=Acrobeloides nanus TaxID=290746 RepID=A0A914CG92_9BILA